MTDNTDTQTSPHNKQLIAARALAEAEQRRADIDARTAKTSDEINGRGGLDPARFGDWEIKGLAADF